MLTLCQSLDTMKEKLVEIQARHGWQDAEMASRLGIARSTWTDVKNGRLAVSDRLQMKAVRAFPELLSHLVTSVTLTHPETAA